MMHGFGEMSDMKEDFFSMVSHELNTPIAALMLQLELIKRLTAKSRESDTSHRVRTHAEQALTLTKHLSTLLDECLELIQIREGHLEMRKEVCNLAAIVEESITRWNAKVVQNDRKLSLQTQGEVMGMFDYERLGQAIHYLISSVAQYGRDQSIQVFLEECRLRLRIVIRCPGDDSLVEPFLLPRIGFYIVYEIIKAHDGTLRVESESNGGIRVVVDLPENIDELGNR
jgi:signal transduction histidine kinase